LNLAVGQAAMQAADYLLFAPDVVRDLFAGAYGRFLALEDIFDGHGCGGYSSGVEVEQTGVAGGSARLYQSARKGEACR
jgi:hypothetical protein